VVVFFAAAPLAVDRLVTLVAGQDESVGRIYIDPSVPMLLVAPMVVAALFYISRLVFRDVVLTKRTAPFYGWAAFFGVANVINYCSPGYCEWIGVPFQWHSWSDSISPFDNGVSPYVSFVAGVGNLAFFAVITASLAVISRPKSV